MSLYLLLRDLETLEFRVQYSELFFKHSNLENSFQTIKLGNKNGNILVEPLSFVMLSRNDKLGKYYRENRKLRDFG